MESNEKQIIETNDLIGDFIDENCHKCGATLLGNKRGDKWCSNAGGVGTSVCEYGLKDEPSDQQIITELATKVMGWKKGRAEDWDGYNWFAKDTWTLQNGQYQADGSWNPLQNIADAWMLVDRVEADGLSWCISRLEYGKVEALIGNGSATAKTAQEAISMAIYGVLTKR